MTPTVYYDNMLALGVLSGTNTDEAYPVRRVADQDVSLPWPVISGSTSGFVVGEIQLTLGEADTRDAFVLPRGTGLSGFEFRVLSDDVGGGSETTHLVTTRAGDEAFVIPLSGATTPRRVWRVLISGVTSGLATPIIYEAMLATRLDFPRRPQIGVERSIIQQVQRIGIPGGAPFRVRLGQELNRTVYRLIVEESALSGFQTFCRVNDGGQPFWFVDDLGQDYWSEAPSAEYVFDDQAGVYFFPITVQEIPSE
jgi:hypothetical protein